MLNRYLALLVAIVAPLSAAAMLFAGARPLGAVTLAERSPSVALAILAMTLAALHLRNAPTSSARAEATMWCGIAIFLCVAAFASPHLSVLGIVGTLSLAATSVVRLVARRGGSTAQSQGRCRVVFAPEAGAPVSAQRFAALAAALATGTRAA